MQAKTLLAAIALAVSSAALADHPLTVDAGNLATPAKIQPALLDRISAKSADNRIRVIVNLEQNTPPGLTRAQAIAKAQDRVIGAFSNENNGQGLAVLARYQTLFGFSAELTSGQIKALSQRSDVQFVEEMPVHEKMDAEAFPLTDVDLAQAGGADGTGAVIAIIDDGIDASLPDFQGKFLGGYDFADFDSDPTNDCLDQSHGTNVAGVALGAGPTAIGVAPDADFVFLKIQSASICGQASLDGDIVGAIDWAVANKDTYGIDIISMSLGGGSYSSEGSCDGSSTAYFNSIRNAVNAGITVIAASGNDGLCDAMSRPACFSDVVSVGAVYDEPLGNIGWCVSRNTCAATTAGYNCGIGRTAAFEDAFADNVIVYSNSASFLDVVAPSTCASSVNPGGSANDCFGGTSSATPFTSGVAALAVEAAGKGVLSPSAMRALLADSGESVTDPKNGRVSPRVNGQNTVVNAGGSSGGNNPPTAAFTFDCTDLSCSFDASGSSDSDGSISSYDWTFGDGGTASGATANHTYGADGSYTVTLTVTDNESATDSDSQLVTVSGAPTGGITLSGSGYKVKGRHNIDLSWDGASSSNVDIYRDGSLLTTTANDGAYTDSTNNRGGASYVYEICEAGTSTCSNSVTVVF